jgi:hypothetical protein
MASAISPPVPQASRWLPYPSCGSLSVLSAKWEAQHQKEKAPYGRQPPSFTLDQNRQVF